MTVTIDTLQTMDDLKDIRGKRVLVRVDYNVPLGDNGIVDDDEAWRIKKSFATINELRDKGARIILISHIGRDPEETLQPVVDYINEHIGYAVGFIPVIQGDVVDEAIRRLGDGHVILLENVRSNPGEKGNDKDFAEKLASYADIYINDAFSVSHRAHASVVGIPALLPAYAGRQLEDEVRHLSVVDNPAHPYVVMLGGAKFGTKLTLLEQEIATADTVIVGGALAHTIYKARGLEIGKSLVDDEVDVSSYADNEKLWVPDTVLVQHDDDSVEEAAIEQVQTTDTIVDIAPSACETIAPIIKHAQTILWNGPFGWYEKGFTTGTDILFDMVGENTGTTVLGGGDTVTVLLESGKVDNFIFVSTAGGAMLDYVVDGTLVGLKPLLK